ncbi:hypothetical protein BJY01DRAFT_117725 [Aspergillus pseudoustus]|uniref:Uncharacterized protein n=1 Tax=Aspergillus pseudoustus TaxID=1810923 RepID=A0ABR4ISA6_9EURO
MLPPSNNMDNPLLQYLEKLAAVAHRPRHTVTSARPPPPPYTASFSPQDSDHDWDEDCDVEGDSDACYDITPEHCANRISAINSSTVTINLNSSIQVKGNANTIIIASGSAHQQSGSYPSPRHQQQETANNGPNSKLVNTTSAIVSALQKSGVLSAQTRSGSSPTVSVKINIDAGIQVDGARNVVCFGSGSIPLARRYYDVVGRKRRAQSEPLAGAGAEEKRTRVA